MAITYYYCVILKMVILDDAIKTIPNGVFPFSLKKNEILFLLRKTKSRLFKNKKTVGLFLSKKRVFLNPGPKV